MIDRIRRQLDDHDERLAGHERKIAHLEVEEERTRTRLHRMEGDRAAIRELVATTRTLAEQTRALGTQVAAGVGQLEAIAENAAEKAVTKTAARRSSNRWRVAGRLASHVVAFASLGYLIAYLIFR